MDEYTTEEMKCRNGFDAGHWKGDAEGYARGLAEAAARNVRESVYPNGGTSILACPRCGSGEYLTNEDGDKNCFCGQCGQALDWTEPVIEESFPLDQVRFRGKRARDGGTVVGDSILRFRDGGTFIVKGGSVRVSGTEMNALMDSVFMEVVPETVEVLRSEVLDG